MKYYLYKETWEDGYRFMYILRELKPNCLIDAELEYYSNCDSGWVRAGYNMMAKTQYIQGITQEYAELLITMRND